MVGITKGSRVLVVFCQCWRWTTNVRRGSEWWAKRGLYANCSVLVTYRMSEATGSRSWKIGVITKLNLSLISVLHHSIKKNLYIDINDILFNCRLCWVEAFNFAIGKKNDHSSNCKFCTLDGETYLPLTFFRSSKKITIVDLFLQ